MNKLNKLVKVKKILIAIIVILLIIMISVIFIFIRKTPLVKYHTQYNARPASNYNCLKKGEVCSYEDIMNSIKVEFQVEKGVYKDFYLISNDENTATYIMDSNVKDDVNWHIEGINFRGPTKAYMELIDATSDWDNLEPIRSYKYEDYGNKEYHDKCDDLGAQAYNKLYDCSKQIVPARGYQSIEFSENGITIHINKPKDSDMKDPITYDAVPFARLVTFEEVFYMKEDSEYPDWLFDNLGEGEGYWTMSSTTSPTLNYNQGAFAIVNLEGKPKLVELRTMFNPNKTIKNVGIRPIITVEKV